MRREWAVAIAIAALAIVLAVAAPSYFSAENLRDLFLVTMPVLVAAIGTMLVILTGEIDISVGSAFAICSVVSGVVAKAGVSAAGAGLAACAAGAALGALNGALVAYGRIPSIVATLAAMVALRDGLRWITQGAWIEDLPARFQWLGVTQASFPLVAAATVVALFGAVAWTMRHVAAGRAVYATGSNAEAARLAGINTAAVKLSVFTIAGALTGLAALLNSVRFNQIPTNTGLGLEMKVIAAVVVGGTAITGGRGTFTGTLLGVILLGAVGPALTFLGVSAQWERALQGAIILAAVTIDAVRLPRGARLARTDAAGV
ncbi:MAG TPA: ABC transporter permease [Vicinamibacterales bacterium]|nr:ABC transporter permease [Vicinamibacterales bacterium]